MIYLVVWATLLQLGRKVGGGDGIAKYIAYVRVHTQCGSITVHSQIDLIWPGAC
jgi:hypothetical protein